MATNIPSPVDITLPQPDSTTAREHLSTYLRLQYRTLLALPLGALLGDPEGAAAFTGHLRGLAKSDPGAVFTILRKPPIGGLIRLIATRSGNGHEMRAWAIELIAQVQFELATRGLGDGKVLLNGPIPNLLSLQRRIALPLPSDARSVRFAGGTVTVESATDGFTVDAEADEDRFTSPYHEVFGPVVLTEVDNNPRAGMEAHPDKSGNHVDLGAKTSEDWANSLREAFAIVAEYAPSLVPEIELVVHQIVPVGFEPEKHLSASMMEVVGNVYSSLHPDPVVMAEAIVHEFSHNKINILWTLNPLLENAFEPLYASPVRPDPRPLFGVMLAAHAFLPVEHMYRAMQEKGHPLTKHPRFEQRLAQVRAANDEATKTVVKNGQPTPTGVNVVEELRQLNERFAAAS